MDVIYASSLVTKAPTDTVVMNTDGELETSVLLVEVNRRGRYR